MLKRALIVGVTLMVFVFLGIDRAIVNMVRGPGEWKILQKKLEDLKLRHTDKDEAIKIFGPHHDISIGTSGGQGLENFLQHELKMNARNTDALEVREKWLKWTNGVAQSTHYSRAWIFFDQSNRVADYVLLGN